MAVMKLLRHWEGPPERCARCSGRDVRPSHLRNTKDELLYRLNVHPFRCRSCRKRMWRLIQPREIRLRLAGGERA